MPYNYLLTLLRQRMLGSGSVETPALAENQVTEQQEWGFPAYPLAFACIPASNLPALTDQSQFF